MFDSLSDQMKHDDAESTKTSERIIRWLAVLVISVLLFGGLYFGIKMLEA
jgi:Ni,Fe-hydrogenase I cytochrome b subunit